MADASSRLLAVLGVCLLASGDDKEPARELFIQESV